MLYGICIVLAVIWDAYILNGLRTTYRLESWIYSKSTEEIMIRENDERGLEMIYALRSRNTGKRFIDMLKCTYLWGYYKLTENR